jgi:UDP-N-acetylmuramoyl-tripeptide--D-alanyl-D-alanine ligase
MGKKIPSLKINLIGKQFALNASFSAAAALLMGLSEDSVREGLSGYIPGAMRQNIYERDGIKIIADCYNAAPESTRAAIDTLCAISVAGKRIALLGDMRELGEDSERMHREVGQYAARAGVDMLYTLGESGAYIAVAAIASGMSAHNVFAERDCENIESLVAEIKAKIQAGDAILFKASRGVRLERVISALFG